MSDYPMLISNKLHSFRNFSLQIYAFFTRYAIPVPATESICSDIPDRADIHLVGKEKVRVHIFRCMIFQVWVIQP